MKDFTGSFNCNDDAADAVCKVLREHDLHANCAKMGYLSRSADYVAVDVFDGRERLVGWFYVSSDTGLYSFEFHSC
jgi:hypothetical protein